jgi:transposase InsO family protein
MFLVWHQKLGKVSEDVLKNVGFQGKLGDWETCLQGRWDKRPSKADGNMLRELRCYWIVTSKLSRGSVRPHIRGGEISQGIASDIEDEGRSWEQREKWWAPEYQSKDLQKYFREEGVPHEITRRYCPQQNGLMERLSRTVMGKCRDGYQTWSNFIPLRAYDMWFN